MLNKIKGTLFGLAIGEEFLNWYNSRPKDVGVLKSTALSTFNEKWFETAKNAHYQNLFKLSEGNGSLIRFLHIALAFNDIEKSRSHYKKTLQNDPF